MVTVRPEDPFGHVQGFEPGACLFWLVLLGDGLEPVDRNESGEAARLARIHAAGARLQDGRGSGADGDPHGVFERFAGNPRSRIEQGSDVRSTPARSVAISSGRLSGLPSATR